MVRDDFCLLLFVQQQFQVACMLHSTSTRALTVTNHKHSKRKSLIPRVHTMAGTDAPNVVTQSTWSDSNALPRSINAKLAINLAISQVCATKRNMHTPNQGDLRCTNCEQVLFTHAMVCHMTTQMVTALPMTYSACK